VINCPRPYTTCFPAQRSFAQEIISSLPVYGVLDRIRYPFTFTMPLIVNEYFDGNVKSIGFQTKTLPATVGVMVPGEYTFNTSKKEVVTVISGLLTVQLPGTEDWKEYHPQSVFEVAANESFSLKVTEDTAYLCTYE
jgi:purine/pyrimidine-nucleoside phosphorylase